MNKNKGLKYYAFIFGVSVVAIGLYIIVLAVQGNLTGGITEALTWFLVPVVFVGFLFIFDKLFNLILPKKYRSATPQKTEFQEFLDLVNEIVGKNLELTLEEERRLRENVKFQKSLSQVFTILKHGENDEISWEYLQKKFKKDSKESEALNLVIESVKKS